MSSPPSTAQPSAWDRWWHALSARQPSESGWPSAIRRGGLVGLICIVGAATGTYAEAAVIAIGALNIGLVDGAVPRKTLAKALLLVAILGSLIAGISSFLAGSWWTVPMLMIFAYLLGSYGGLGLVAFNTSFMCLVMAILFTNDPGNFGNAVKMTVLVFIGSVAQLSISLLAWRYERESTIRRAIGLAIEEILRSVQSDSEELAPKLSAAAYCNRAQGALEGAHLDPERERLYTSVLDQLNWSRLYITSWLTIGDPTQPQRDYLASRLRHVDNLIRSNPLSKPATAGGGTGTQWLDLVEQLDKLEEAAQQLHDVKYDLSEGKKRSRGHSRGKRPDAVMSTASGLRSLHKILLPSSPTFRHAVRLTLAIGVAQTVVMFAQIDRGYWVPLTVCMVVKPDFKTTFVRGALRIAGTIAAIVIVGGIMAATNNTAWVMAALVLVTAPLTMRWMSANYAFAAFAISSTVLLLVEGGDPNDITYLLRLQNTLIGVIISIAAYAAIPSWTVDHVRDLLVDVVRTQREWTAQTLRAWQAQVLDLAVLRQAGDAARQAALQARPSLESASLEPHHASIDPLAALDVLDSCQRAAIACVALEVELHNSSHTTGSVASDVSTFVDYEFELTMANLGDSPLPSPTGEPGSRAINESVSSIHDESVRRALQLLTSNVENAAQIAPNVVRAPTNAVG